jgi:uncharacterized protein (TIGR00725 family)
MTGEQNTFARRTTVAVIGDARIRRGGRQEALAFEIGRELIDAGFCLVTGGLGGVMQAAHQGARASKSWHGGAGIGLLPGSDPDEANPYVDLVIPTGLDHARNLVIAQSRAVIAIGGGAGTLSEMAFAWIHKRLVIGLRCGGWSERLADERIDERQRYPEIPEDRVFGADTGEEALVLLRRWLPLYQGNHRTIR